jgi:thiamine-monophosphate kinase
MAAFLYADSTQLHHQPSTQFIKMPGVMEHELIETIKDIAASNSETSGIVESIGDDCAIIAPSGGRHIVVTTDTLEEGIHFDTSYFSPYFLGRKLAAVNLSDIAAMGADPKWAFLNLSLPAPYMDSNWINELARGIISNLSRYGATLVGGDTVSAMSHLSLTLTLAGEVMQKEALRRKGACPGDLLYCSGFTGEAGAGLILLQNPGLNNIIGRIGARKLIHRHLDPSPRIDLGRALSRHGLASSATDISDGIATDLSHICNQSGVKAVIDMNAIPISRSMRQLCKTGNAKRIISGNIRLYDIPPHTALALAAGEDFEIIWTVPPESEKKCIRMTSKIIGHAPFRLGIIQRGKGVWLKSGSKKMEITHKGYEH